MLKPPFALQHLPYSLSKRLLRLRRIRMTTMSTSTLPQHFWLVDTRPLWNPSPASAVPNPPNTTATTATTALSVVPDSEREKAKRFHFHRDAKLSLASSLLKRHFVTTCFPSTKFSDLEISRRADPKHGKPCYNPSPHAPLEEREAELDFNISHQAGLVCLAGYARRTPGTLTPEEPSITVGVDITNSTERRAQDTRFIEKQSFEGWVDMHGDVFSPTDLAAMREPEIDDFGVVDDSPLGFEARIRRFYAYWCLKEAYVKLEGEALLAGWLKDVSFQNVRVPQGGSGPGQWGEHMRDIEVWRNGTKEEATRMELRAWGDEFMVGLAVKGDKTELIEGNWEMLDIESVVKDVANT